MRRLFEGQWLHVLALGLLLVGIGEAAELDVVRQGRWRGVRSASWLWLSVGIAVAHQVYVWFCWRVELHFSLISRVLGDRGFPAYATLFTILGAARVTTVTALAYANRGSIPWEPAVLRAAAVLCVVPVGYLAWSVHRHFGYRRALGIDHFDRAYAALPFVEQGIFRFSRNAMYVFGFLLLWIPGLWFGSAAALLAALFGHIYVFVHYLATERPDMQRIYGEGGRAIEAT